MHRSVSVFPHDFNAEVNQNIPMEIETSTELERDQLAPVDLITKAATTLSLPPLQWSHYSIMPDNIFAKNTGFTVSIQASYTGEVPYVSSGPLTGKYNFTQVHFHWGENDETGSGHSVDGVRYPLEMHVVHVKKEFDNVKEAGKAKDGIAIVVHLFSLTEERNSHLDQLTAVLQFIQKPNCCAKLYPSSLSEIVQPFSKDYFLYWGAVSGPSQHNYPITWLVSRNVLPVSSQQLQQFRQLYDRRGQLILLNSNTPHPLGDRSLFLVSPSDKSSGIMIGNAQQSTRSIITLESEKSIEIRNAEFKSLVALEDAELGSCMICPHANHAGYDTPVSQRNTNRDKSKNPLRIREGDTSVEESCVDLGTLQESQVTEKTKLKLKESVHKTDYSYSCSSKYVPSQSSLTSSNKEEICIKHKPLTIKKHGPSTEEACMFLTKSPSVHAVQSVPSLTAWGYLNKKQEFASVSSTPEKNNSSEVVVLKQNLLPSDNCKNGEEIENLTIKSKFKNTSTQVSVDVYIDVEKEYSHHMISQGEYPGPAGLREHFNKEVVVAQLKSRENELRPGEALDDGFQTEYLLVKQAEPKKSFYKVVGELLLTPDSKRQFVKRESNPNETCLAEVRDESKHQPLKEGSSNKNSETYNKTVISVPPSKQDTNNNQIVKNGNQVQTENINKIKSKNKPDESSLYRINLRVQKPVSAQEDIEEKKERPPLYYVTKITPVNGSKTENQEVSTEKKLYYAKRINMESERITGKPSQSHKHTSSTKYDTSNTIPQQMYDITKQDTYSQSTEDDLKGQDLEVNISISKKLLVDNESTKNRITNTSEKSVPSDHILKRKRVTVVAPYENAKPAETMNVSQPKSLATNFTDSTSSSLKDPKTKIEILKGPQGSAKSVDILKSEITYQVTKTNKDYFPDMETASNKHKELAKNDHANRSNNAERTKSAQGVNNEGESTKYNEFQEQLNLEVDKESIVNNNKTKPKQSITQIGKSNENKTITYFGNINTVNSSNSAEIVVEEVEENVVYSSQKSKKKITVQKTKPTFKIAIQPPVVTSKLSSQHLITLKKVEIPDPYYLTRVPKPPLIVFEALPFGQHQQNEILETEKKSSEVKRTRTLTSFKKGYIKDVVDTSVPTEILTTEIKNIKDEKFRSNITTDSAVGTTASIYNQIFKPGEDNLNVNVNYKSKVRSSTNSPNTNNKENYENTQQITVDIYQSKMPSKGQKSHSQNDDKRTEVKSTRIIIGSHHPLTVGGEETKSFNKTTTSKENTLETIIQSDQQDMHSTGYQIQPDDIQNNIPSLVDTRRTMTNLHDQTLSKKPIEITTDEDYEPNRKYIDAATSNPTTSLTFNAPYSQHQKTQTISYVVFQEEPTKDPGFESVDKQQQTSKTEVLSIKADDSEEENSLPSVNLNINRTILSTTNTDGKMHRDAIIYLHRPTPGNKSSSKQFSVDETKDVPILELNKHIEKETEIKQNTKSEKIISNSKKTSIPRKSVSVGTYQHLVKSDTAPEAAPEELISSHDYESGRDVIIDPAHCNVIFQNEARVELPSGEKAHMKSVAEVKLKPLTKSSNPNKTTRFHVEPSSKGATDRATITTEDKCCSAIGFRKDRTSVDTSEEDEPTIKESIVINSSPVRIETEKSLYKNCPSLEFIGHWNGINKDALMENNGKTLRATILSETELPLLRGGPFKSDYIFGEVHFHWGQKDCCGAEHIIDEQRRSMEAHFMYFKKEYGSVSEGLKYEDGLAVVAIQMNVGGPPNPLFDKLFKDIALIREANTGVYVPAESLFAWIKQTVKKAKGYFTYKSTLTTEPPPIESVTWLIFQQPVILCCQQSLEFRKLMSQDGRLLLKNYRTTRPINKRPVCYVPK